MDASAQERAKRLFHKTFDQLSAHEQQLLMHMASGGGPISYDINNKFDGQLTFGQRVADRVASFGGSWTFILLFTGVLISWIILNTVLALRNAAFDPYPFILLNLVLSMVAALQAPVIMMSQNRQTARDRLDATHDYAVNLKAELEIASLHEKVDRLREHDWNALLEIQQEQIRMLTLLLEAQLRRPTTPDSAK